MSSEAVVFVGCRVVRLDTARLRYPAPLAHPAFLIEPLESCDELLLTCIRMGNGENQLAVAEVRTALFEQPTPAPLALPGLMPGVELVMEFANRGPSPASFVVWLGTQAGIRLKHAELQAQRVTQGGSRS